MFAYGQTGSGKSYSFVGYGTNKGIMPLACEEIFRRIKDQEGPNHTFRVECAMMEIYGDTPFSMTQIRLPSPHVACAASSRVTWSTCTYRYTRGHRFELGFERLVREHIEIPLYIHV